MNDRLPALDGFGAILALAVAIITGGIVRAVLIARQVGWWALVDRRLADERRKQQATSGRGRSP